MNRIGFVRNAFIQFVIGILTSLSFTSNRISIGLNLGIQCNDIFTYRIAGRYIIPAGKGIIHDALHADDFIFSGNICLGNDFVTVDGRLGSQGTFDQRIAIHAQVATAIQAARIDGAAYIGVVPYADRIGYTGRAGSEFIRYIDRSGGDIARSVDAARGNGIAFNGGRRAAVGEGRPIGITLHFIDDSLIAFVVRTGDLLRDGLRSYRLNLGCAVGNIAIVSRDIVLDSCAGVVQDSIAGLVDDIAAGNSCTIGLSRPCR